jgi:hypothetical protein
MKEAYLEALNTVLKDPGNAPASEADLAFLIGRPLIAARNLR